ncbi:hypothetical protein HDU67_003963, partial [Dinochytrium kinnereticum]
FFAEILEDEAYNIYVPQAKTPTIAPFARLWGSPANSSTATKTYRQPVSKKMIVKMKNPDSLRG